MPDSFTVFHTPLDWDSKILGLKCGTVLLPPTGTDDEKLARSIMEAIPPGEALTLCKLSSSYPRTATELIRLGGRIVDSELIFRFHAAPHQPPGNIEVHSLTVTSPEPFLPLATQLIHSRLAMDPLILQEKAQRLWRESIRNLCSGRADLLVEARINGQPAGLAAIVDEKDGRNIFFLGVLAEHRRQGVGTAILHHLGNQTIDRPLRVEALASNTPALAAYVRGGFNLESMRYILHIHAEELSNASRTGQYMERH